MIPLRVRYTVAFNGCWIWSGPRSANGYGHFGRDGRTVSAHRAVWEAERGPIPDGQLIRHRCDNRACVNPDHLELGTHGDNMRDRNERARQARGERQGHSRLTAEQVLEIRRRRELGETTVALAAAFGIHQTTASDIARCKSWRHI